MTTTEIDSLIYETDNPCISIIIPTRRIWADKENEKILRKAVQAAKAMLYSKDYPESSKKSIEKRLDQIQGNLPSSIQDGLGIFISPKHTTSFSFPFPVREKIVVDDNFETRDLFYLDQFLSDYYVLSLSKNNIHFFKASAGSMEEIKENGFPFHYEEQYEYARPTMNSSSYSGFKDFEKDKSALSSLRIQNFMREADQQLGKYLRDETTPLVIAGTRKLLSDFGSTTRFSKNIVGKVTGSFQKNQFSDLEKFAWRAYRDRKKNEHLAIIEELNKQSNGHVVRGLQNAWKAAHEGKGLLLVIEKDYQKTAYLEENNNKLFLRPPKGNYKVLQDAVDELIKVVHRKGGKVTFIDNDQLENEDKLMLLLRYGRMNEVIMN